MIKPIQNATLGLQKAGNDAVRAASEISRSVRAAVDAYAQTAELDNPNRPTGIQPRAPRTQGNLVPTETAEPDLVSGIAQLKQATTAYKANAKVLATVNETYDSLLDVKL